MAKLIFKYSNGWKQNVREANEIKFDVPDDMNLNEYKAIVIRLSLLTLALRLYLES